MTLALPLSLVLAAVPWSALDGGALAEAQASLSGLPLSARLEATSAGFLGTPYVLSPLGEGEGPDPDPLERFDAVDCVTYVEEAMALALAPTPGRVLPTLTQLRYGSGEPAWAARNHVMEAQWLPENLRKGYVVDVTRKWGGEVVRTVQKKLDAQTWRQKSAQALALPPEAQPQGTYALDIVPAADALEVLSRAPSMLMVVVVRADKASLVTRVSHVGFLEQGPKGPLLRHASRSFGKVVDEPLARFLARNLKHGAWTIEGLALYEVREPSPPTP